MRGSDEFAKLLFGSKFWIDAEIVFHSVGAPQTALSVNLANRVDRHEPEDIDA